MDTLRSEQIKELREHRAIPRGGWKLLAGTIVTFVLLANCVWVSFQMLTWLADLPGALEVGISAIFMSATMLGIGIYTVTGARREWVARYWQQTVIGRVARFYFSTETGEGGKQRRKLAYLIATRREDAHFRWQTPRVLGGVIRTFYCYSD